MMHLVAYDIADDNVRARVANRLLSAGYRLQRSVFQLEGSEDLVLAIMREVAAMIDDGNDIVHVFRVCESCVTHRSALGQGTVDRPPTHWSV
jgi:CRISPR-associated protein Cas2